MIGAYELFVLCTLLVLAYLAACAVVGAVAVLTFQGARRLYRSRMRRLNALPRARIER